MTATPNAFEAAAAAVGELDDSAGRAAAEHHDRLTKPRGSLGRVEAIGTRLAAITGASPPPVPAPARTFCRVRPGAASSSVATPTSTTITRAPVWRASTLIAAPPARKFWTIWAVTSCGHGVTPSASTPWSPANTATAAGAGTGGGDTPVMAASRP